MMMVVGEHGGDDDGGEDAQRATMTEGVHMG